MSNPPAGESDDQDPEACPDRRRNLLTNSTVALLLGSGIAVLLHELGHWFTAAGLGYRAILHGFAVDYLPPPTGTRAALIMAAGPVVSLLLGLVMQIVQPFRFRGGFLHLLWIWLACSGLQAFATTLAIAPLTGDAAMVIKELGLPGWTTWVACAAGIGGIVSVAQQWAVHAVRHSGRDLGHLRSFSWYPWLIAIGIACGLNAAQLATAGAQLTLEDQIVVVLAGMSGTMFAPLSMLFTHRAKELQEPLLLTGFPWGGAAAWLALTGFGFAIGGGIPLG